MNITISEVRYTPNSPDVLISWQVSGGLFNRQVSQTNTTQDKLQARVTAANGTWGDDEVLGEVRADLAARDTSETHTVSLATQPPQLYPAAPTPAVPVDETTPAAG